MIAKIKFDLPEGADIADIAEFIDDALSSWGGQRRPEDPLFGSLRGKMDYIIVHRKKYLPSTPKKVR